MASFTVALKAHEVCKQSKTQHATFKVRLSLAAGSPFTVDKVSKVYVRTCITLEPNASGGEAALQDN